ncbi:hypothetical protein OG524_36965 (plasmid) [Streptomyces sp. NBC_01520]|uniref:hypothetical protein n=1 Tax=Streptomyces sp. NBC_01520 TaxID=2903892 RepID=UPI003868ABE7
MKLDNDVPGQQAAHDKLLTRCRLFQLNALRSALGRRCINHSRLDVQGEASLPEAATIYSTHHGEGGCNRCRGPLSWSQLVSGALRVAGQETGSTPVSKSQSVSCVENGSPSRRGLSGAEAIVIIVIVTVAAVMTAGAGMTVVVVLQVVLGAGLTSVLVVGLVTGAPVRGLRAALRALLAPAA